MIIYLKNLIKLQVQNIGFSKKTLVKIHPKFDLINRSSKYSIVKYSFGNKNPIKNFMLLKGHLVEVFFQIYCM